MIKGLYDTFAEIWRGSIWIYSDPHFGDEEMQYIRKDYIGDREQLKRINSKVGRDDIFVCLGDVGSLELISHVHGHKVLVMGNHDKGATNYKRVAEFIEHDLTDAEVEDYEAKGFEVRKIDSHRWFIDNHLFDEVYEGVLVIGPRIILSHEPVDFHYCFNIHGHDHSGWYKGEHHFNACAEHIGYTPVCLNTLLKKGLFSGVADIHRDTIDTATTRAKARRTSTLEEKQYMEQCISKHYYVELLNSSKANQFTAYYHYSGVGCKKARINQGIYRRSDNVLVGVLQWGISAQEGIRLDRYVKEPIAKEEYLELNRFCMADEEGKNAESEAISLGIKWLRRNRPDIRLLVSYSGRKEGNYGYIYQATSWEYLGYFISNGFWLLDGQEKHRLSIWRYCKGVLCQMYHDVRQTWTKQFIYIKRLDKSLTPATPILPYPKPATEYPICTRVEVYQEDKDYQVANNTRGEKPSFVYEPGEALFTRRTLIRQGVIIPDCVAIYDINGDLVDSVPSVSEAARITGISRITITKAMESGKTTKKYAFRKHPSNVEPPETIDVEYICEIDGQRFSSLADIGEYCGVSRQAANSARNRGAKQIGGHEVIWANNAKVVDQTQN